MEVTSVRSFVRKVIQKKKMIHTTNRICCHLKLTNKKGGWIVYTVYKVYIRTKPLMVHNILMVHSIDMDPHGPIPFVQKKKS